MVLLGLVWGMALTNWFWLRYELVVIEETKE